MEAYRLNSRAVVQSCSQHHAIIQLFGGGSVRLPIPQPTANRQLNYYKQQTTNNYDKSRTLLALGWILTGDNLTVYWTI